MANSTAAKLVAGSPRSWLVLALSLLLEGFTAGISVLLVFSKGEADDLPFIVFVISSYVRANNRFLFLLLSHPSQLISDGFFVSSDKLYFLNDAVQITKTSSCPECRPLTFEMP